jgi:serralysin
LGGTTASPPARVGKVCRRGPGRPAGGWKAYSHGFFDGFFGSSRARGFQEATTLSEEDNMAESKKSPNKWCFAWDPGDDPEAGKSRAALVKKNKWPKGSTINVAFLDGDASVQERIKQAVKEWTSAETANLKIVFLNDSKKADVRISFMYDGSWSVIGTACRTIPKDEPSMNYGWLTPASSDEDLRAVVLHEFGHAIGLIHEHQNPGSVIPWNKPNVYRDLSGPPNNWDTATIDANMFDAYSKKETNFTAVDPTSIMMYPIPEGWVTDPKYAAGMNRDLSPQDKKFVQQQYPK